MPQKCASSFPKGRSIALTNRATKARVTGGQVKSFTSYSATGSTVAGLAAQEDAARRLMRILADQITARLLATSGTWNT